MPCYKRVFQKMIRKRILSIGKEKILRCGLKSNRMAHKVCCVGIIAEMVPVSFR